jgi:hypothetical protein
VAVNPWSPKTACSTYRMNGSRPIRFPHHLRGIELRGLTPW